MTFKIVATGLAELNVATLTLPGHARLHNDEILIVLACWKNLPCCDEAI